MTRKLQALGAALVVALACAPDAPKRQANLFAAHRFALQAEALGAAGFAVIAHERRPVVLAHPSHRFRPRPDPARERTLSRRVLPTRFAGATRALVLTRYVDSQGSQQGPARIVPVTSKQGVPEIPFDLPSQLRNGRSLDAVEVIALPTPAQLERVTEPALVPDPAHLEFGFGVLEPAEQQGAVEFSLEVCEKDRCTEAFRETLDPLKSQGWQDRSLSLAAWAGQRVTLRLRTSRPGDAVGNFTLPVWSTPIVYTPRPRTPAQRSVILISLDTLRADRLDVYDARRGTSPFLAERFGGDGVIFDNVVAAATTTGPSHMSIFTSLQPYVHGEGTGPRRTRIHAPTLAELLRAAGFKTGAFTENASINSNRGFGRGFDEFSEDKGGRAGLPKGQIARTLARGLAWLRRHHDKPFFLFLHTYQTHAPYSPPEGYLELVPAASGTGGEALRRYDGEIRYVDDQLREFFAALEREEIADTVVIVTSDHGEEFGEHGFEGHGVTLNAEVTQVPLMLIGAEIPRGVRVAQPVAHVDFMPTILELADVPVPDHAMGRSFIGMWQPGASEVGDAPPAYTETWHDSGLRWDGEREHVGTPAFAVRAGSRKLIRYRDPIDGTARYESYDLAHDPAEKHDRPNLNEPEVAALRLLLDGYPQRMESLRSRLSSAFGTSRGRKPLEIDPKREQKLRALGYLVD